MANLGEFGVAAAETNQEPDTFSFCGETFTVATKVGIIPLGRFAQAAASGLDTAEMDGLAALIDVVAGVVVDDDRDRFLSVASKNRASADDLLPIVQAVMEAQSGRPTERPSDSSDGSPTTGESSKELSSSVESSTRTTLDDPWAQTPAGRRELAANPDFYADVLPIQKAAARVAEAG